MKRLWSLTLTFYLSLFCALINLSAQKIELSLEEKAWLAQNHTIRVSFSQHPPYIYMKDGSIVGIVVDLLDEISKHSGLTFQYQARLHNFSENLNGLKAHEGPDLIGALMPTDEREKEILFTEAYITSPNFIFTRINAPPCTSLETLLGRKVAVVKDYEVHKHLARNYPDMDLLPFATNEEALQAVSFGNAFAFIGDLASTPAMIGEFGLKNLKAACPSGLPDHPLAIGIRNDWPELQGILNKTLEAIPINEKTEIINKWTTVRVDYGIRTVDIVKWVLIVFGVAIIVIGFFIFWNQSLKRKVEERTVTLSESEERFRATFEQAAVGMVHASPDGRFIRINQKFCEITGYSHEELKTFTFREITHPDDLEADNKYVNQLLSGKRDSYVVEKRYIRKSGELTWVNLTVNLVRDESGEPQWFVGVVEDINDRKQAEEEIRISRERFQLIFQISPASIAISRVDNGEFVNVNQAFERDFGYSPEEVVGRTSMEIKLWKNVEDRGRIIPELQEKGYLHIPTLELNRKSGETAIFDARSSLMLVDNMEYVIAVFFDISNQKKAEQQVKKYQKRLKAMASELTLAEEKQRKEIATDLHDHVGQLLALSRLQLAAIHEGMDKNEIIEKLKPISEGLLQSIQSVRTAIFDLSSPQLNEIGLYAAVRDWLDEQVEEKYGISTELTGDDQNYPLAEDLRFLLFRSIRELLMNVVKHARATKVRVNINKNEDSLSIRIKDNGSGFRYSPQMLQMKSTGFGLFSIQERMEDSAGSLHIDTAPGRGTEVKLIVPLSKA